MVRTTKSTTEWIKFDGYCSFDDIAEGECLKVLKCMLVVSVERVLRKLDPSMPYHYTRVDAGHIKFNWKGRRAIADTPRICKTKLIEFDKEYREWRKAKKNGLPFKSSVEPFPFTIKARLGRKIEKTTPERKAKINENRSKRIAAGHKPKQYTLHERVVGFA